MHGKVIMHSQPETSLLRNCGGSRCQPLHNLQALKMMHTVIKACLFYILRITIISNSKNLRISKFLEM